MNFYPRPPRGGRPYRSNPPAVWQKISIHALREEGDLFQHFYRAAQGAYFYPRPPRGGRPLSSSPLRHLLQNFYPRPPRGGRRRLVIILEVIIIISIHALREEGDLRARRSPPPGQNISIHALREEGDARVAKLQHKGVISIHALREEGDLHFKSPYLRGHISIHALREEGDLAFTMRDMYESLNFYPRPPRGGRLVLIGKLRVVVTFLSTPSARRAT